jgi:hypothetical protein
MGFQSMIPNSTRLHFQNTTFYPSKSAQESISMGEKTESHRLFLGAPCYYYFQV